MTPRITAILSLTLTWLLLGLGIADAQNSVPGPIRPGGAAPTAGVAPGDLTARSLSSATAGLNLGLAVGVGVLLIGLAIGLLVIGLRISRRPAEPPAG